MRLSSQLLINEPPLQVLPSLAVRIGLEEAMILQQVHYWLQRSPHDRDGRKWIWNSYADWVKQFPFWNEQKIGRHFRSLEKQGLLLSGNYNTAKYDKTKWYTVDYDRLSELNDHHSSVNEDNSPANDHHSPVNDEPSSVDDLYQETTPEITSETTPETTTLAAVAALPVDSAQHVLALTLQPLQPQKEKPKRAPTMSLACEKYHELTDIWPNRVQKVAIDGAVDSRYPVDLEKWGTVITRWRLKNFSPTNVEGMLQWYRNGIPEYKANGNGGTNGNGQKTQTEPRGFAGIRAYLEHHADEIDD